MVSRKPERRLLAVAMLTALVLMSQSALAQDTPTTATAEDDEPTTLATMVVTAQKREEQMQDVPIAITSLSEQLLQDTGVRDIKDCLLYTSPSPRDS